MTVRRLLIVALVLLALPASAYATASQPTLSYPSGRTLTMFAPADGTAMTVTLSVFHSCFFGCGPFTYDATAGGGWNDSTGGRCTQDGSNASLYHCGAASGGNPTLTIAHGTPANDSITANCAFLFSDYTGKLQADGGDGDDTLTGSCETDTLDGGAGNDTLDGDLFGNDTLTGGDGNDTLKGGNTFGLTPPASVTMSGGAGRDTLLPGDGNDTLDGGDGGDRIEAGAGNDTITGGGGSDYIIPGVGNDTVSGGDGRDTVSYEERDGSQPVTVKLDGQADSGVPGETDTINTDVENIVGSPAGDTIVGSSASNQIDAGDGNDTISPGGGADQVDAGNGDDTINARDGAQDSIDCGAGNDKAVIDEFDSVSNCETVDSSRELMSDVDNDGIPAPADCNDHDPTIRPGLPDKPGDGIDQNCDGHDEPFPRILSTVQSNFAAKGKNTTVLDLTVVDPPPGAKIQLTCKGKKCFKGTKTVTVPASGAGTADARKPIKKLKFHPGQVLELRIVATDQIGKVVDFKMKNNDPPAHTLLCLPPGATKPAKC